MALSDEHRRLTRMLLELAEEARAVLSHRPGSRDRLATGVLVRLADTWTEYCRQFALLHVRGTVSESGRVVDLADASIANEADLVARHFNLNKRRCPPTPERRRRTEPDWGDLAKLESLLSSAAASDLVVVQAASNSFSATFELLRSLRNFAVHRNQWTALEVRRVGAARGLAWSGHPMGAVGATRAGGRLPVVLEIIEECGRISRLLSH